MSDCCDGRGALIPWLDSEDRSLRKGQHPHVKERQFLIGLPSTTTRRTEVNAMTQPTEQEIKKRAYEIWERHGRPKGKEDEFWQQAEQELRNEDKSSPIRTPDTL